jgi:hypothetical protein
MIPLKKQVVSLELARRLKELGVKQENVFLLHVFKRTGKGELLRGYGGETAASGCIAPAQSPS